MGNYKIFSTLFFLLSMHAAFGSSTKAQQLKEEQMKMLLDERSIIEHAIIGKQAHNSVIASSNNIKKEIMQRQERDMVTGPMQSNE